MRGLNVKRERRYGANDHIIISRGAELLMGRENKSHNGLMDRELYARFWE